jgi:hypothetical protein
MPQSKNAGSPIGSQRKRFAMYIQTQGSVIEGLAGMITTLIVFSLMLSVVIMLVIVLAVLIAIGVALYLIMRRWVIPILRKPFETPERMFDAPPAVRWISAYEYWLFLLEEATGIDFTTTPARIFAGCLVISLSPAVVLGLPLAVILHSGTWPLILTVAGIIAGLYTAFKFADGGSGWFQGPPGGSDSGAGGFTLGTSG